MDFNKSLNLIMEKLVDWGHLLVKNIPNIAIALTVIIIFWFLSKLAYSLSQKGFQRTQFNKSLEHLLANLVKITVILLGFIFALGILKLDKTVFSVLAGVGVLGLALGFAFRDLAANFVSGLYLAISAPIKIGEVIKIGDTQGTISEIRLRDTLIKNFAGQDILIPNKEFMTSRIENYSTNGKRKIEISVGIDYEDDLKKTAHSIKSNLEGIDGILKDEGVVIRYDGFGESSINLTAYFWIQYPGGSYLDVKNAAISAIKDVLDKGEFNMPYPTRILKVTSDSNSSTPKELS